MSKKLKLKFFGHPLKGTFGAPPIMYSTRINNHDVTVRYRPEWYAAAVLGALADPESWEAKYGHNMASGQGPTAKRALRSLERAVCRLHGELGTLISK